MKATNRLFGVLLVTIYLSLFVIPVKLAVADMQSKRISVEYEPPTIPRTRRSTRC